MNASGKSIVNIDNPIYSEEDEMDFDRKQGRIDLFEKRSCGKVKCVNTKYHRWTNRERKWWIRIFVMNSKIEMKLGQLLEISFQLKEIMIMSLLKMEETHIVDVCKVIISKH